jgi:ResB-like family
MPVPESREEKILARRTHSPIWRAVHALGSLDLAMLLLITLTGVCAAATFLESGFSARVARAYVYGSPWFNLWLILLCLNLICSAATRWPWQRHHAGFVITHAGIIILLVGALLGRARGFEGSLDLSRDAAPATQVLLDRPRLTVESPATGQLFSTPFDPEVRTPRPDRPRILPLPESDVQLVIDGYTSRSIEKTELTPDPSSANPGLVLEFTGPFGSKPIRLPLVLNSASDSHAELGSQASVDFVTTLPKSGRPSTAPTFRETQMVLAKDPAQPIVHNTSGQSSGFRFFLGSRKSGDPFELEILRPDGSGEIYRVTDLLNRTLDDFSGAKILVARYWPNLILKDGQPTSEGDSPENPAVLVMLEGSLPDTTPSRLTLAPGPTPGTLSFLGESSSPTPATGIIRPGDTFSPGWKGWSAKLVSIEKNSRIETITLPSEKAETRSGHPALHVRLRSSDGISGPARWIASGTSAVLTSSKAASRIGFGLELQPLPFSIRLDSFDVPRDPGTDEPANFRASVTFADPKKNLEVPAQLEMNHPATFPPGLFPQVTGLSYKFSQAGWDPQNLDRTTLQVLHDPGWLLKWSGSLLMVAGIFSMFYLRRVPHSQPTP